MRWQERASVALRGRRVSTGEVAAALGVTPQSAGQKLRGDRGVSVDELRTIARLAGLSVSEMVGDDAVVLELKDEIDLVELYRLLSPEQRRAFLQMGELLAASAPRRPQGAPP